jgi:hypothetical protein
MSHDRDRAARLVAWSYRQVASGNTRLEAFLEEALAAALEAPGFWPRLVALLGWVDAVPSALPAVTTQDVIATGRTDIRLSWGKRSLVLELKVGEAPSAGQIGRYFDAGVDVAAIAKFPARPPVQPPTGSRFLGVITWHRIHSLHWPDAPLEVRQLKALLEAAEVVVPFVNLDALQGMVRSRDAWDAVDRWARVGMGRVARTLSQGRGVSWVAKEGSRKGAVDDGYQRFVHWIWMPPWLDAEGLGLYGGLFLGRPGEPTLVEGLPDLVLALHLNPAGKLAPALAQMPSWESVPRNRTRRQQQQQDGVLRELRPGSWELVRDRAAGILLLTSDNQEQALGDWFEARVNEWAMDSVLTCFEDMHKIT